MAECIKREDVLGYLQKLPADLAYWELDGIEDYVKKIPAADVVEVVPAKMMITDAYPHRIYCGSCFKTLIANEEYCFEKNEYPKFCMWCGAKLER